MRDGNIFDLPADTLGNTSRFAHVGRPEEEKELFAAQTDREVALVSQFSGNDPRHSLQAHIASRVPIAVIERFEMIDVDHDNGNRRIPSFRGRPDDVYNLIEPAAIFQACERIPFRDFFRVLAS